MPPNRAYAYAIEVQGKAAGVVVAQSGDAQTGGAQTAGFQFFASDQRFRALDGRVFRRVEQAERAARNLGRGRGRSGPAYEPFDGTAARPPAAPAAATKR